MEGLDQVLQKIHGHRECHLLYQKVATFKIQVKEGEACSTIQKSSEASGRGPGEEEDELQFNNQLTNQDLIELCTSM